MADSPRDIRFDDNPRGLNTLNKVIVGLARDLPRDLHKAAKFRAAIRKVGR